MKVKILILLILALQLSFSCTDNTPKEDTLCFFPQIDVSVDYRKPEHNDIIKQKKGYFSNHNEIIGSVR